MPNMTNRSHTNDPSPPPRLVNDSITMTMTANTTKLGGGEGVPELASAVVHLRQGGGRPTH